MKNKNKSKVVQKYIKNITSNAGGGGKKEEHERKEKAAKQADMQKAALMNSLFNMGTDKKGRAFDPKAKKEAKQAEEEAIAAGKKIKDEIKKEIIEGIANSIRLTNAKGIRMSELGGHQIIHALKAKHVDTFKVLSLLLFIKHHPKVFWVDDPDNNNPLIRCQEDVEAEVAPDGRTIEEIIEEKRAALPPGGTPVTLESFKAWKANREALRLAQVEADRAEAKKGGGKFTGLSGKDLFTYDASLFVDDDDAADADEYDERSEVDSEDEDKVQDGGAAACKESEDEEEAGEDEEDEEEGDGAARGSAEDKNFEFKPAERKAGKSEKNPGVAINEELFLQGGDLP
eukprot:CAMPEP_0172909056 /NCGR_PEP_ID=MMETSP1075-20121228/181949_1 /TAXON_ID=2916 /ORGANISM="Ceratium fusus, Strain PA161109" /LENGTH=342 /DNA_ID=CAMNT_0013766935 /DNA_START=63 /DNA_END=1088 /DNA_ORIENTATION=-